MAGENQHWVPKFLIKNFRDADGRVFYLDVNTDTLGKRSPRQLASDYGFNEFVIDGQVVSFEGELQKIETRAAPALARIIKQMSTAGLSDVELTAIAEFVSVQSLRTKSFQVGLQGSSLRWSRLFGQNLRLDKWIDCRGYAAKRIGGVVC